MEEALSDLVNRLFTFFTEHFYEIILLLLIFVVIDVVFFVLKLNKKDRVVILHASCLPRQLLERIVCLRQILY